MASRRCQWCLSLPRQHGDGRAHSAVNAVSFASESGTRSPKNDKCRHTPGELNRMLAERGVSGHSATAAVLQQNLLATSSA